MQRPQLSFPSLRARQLALAVKQKNFTRRQFMGLTGTAALGAASQIKPLRHAFEPLEIKGDEDRLAFLLNGQERWVIDPKLFGGSPRLAIEKTSSQINFKLSRATYPGTKLPADLTCELNRVGRRWRMNLRMALGDFHASAPFERWLAGDEMATSTVSLGNTAVELGPAGRLLVSGSPRATFAPGWVTNLRGPRLARLLGAGSSLVSDSFTVSLLDPDAASFIDQPAAKRTLVSLERGKRDWRFENSILLPPGAELEPVHDPFDVIHVEAGESRNGAPVFALVAEPGTDDTRLQFQPNNEFKGIFGEPFRLNLRSAILAAAFDQQNHDRILLAQFAHESVWFEGQQFSVELGDAPNEVPFALANRDGRFAHLHCAPALRGTAFYFAGAVVQPSPCPAGSRLIFDSTGGDVPAELDPQRPTPSPSPTPRRIGPIPGIVVRPTPTPTPTPTPARRPTPRPTPSPTPVPTPPPSGVPPGARPPSTVPPSTATPRPTPRPTPVPTPTPSGFPPGARPPSTQPTPTPTPTPGRPVIPPGVLRPRPTPTPTPTPEARPTPPPRETPTPAEPSSGVISTRPEDLGDLKLHGTFSTVVIRPEDLLVLRLEFINFSLETGKVDAGGRRTPQLVRDDTGRPSYIAVHLPAQNIAEQAFFETATDYPVTTPPKKPVDIDANTVGSEKPSAPPVRTRIAGPSRLVFRVPNNEGPIDYTLAAILEKCGKYTMSVVPHALPPKSTSKLVTVPSKYLISPVIDKPGLGVKAYRAPMGHQIIQQARLRALISVPGKDLISMQKEDAAVKSAIASGMAASLRPPKPRAPNASETALELPYLLILSPNTFGAWAHAQLPVTSQLAKRTELWHTRLGVRSLARVDEENDALRTVRAIWTRDTDFSADDLQPPKHWPDNTLNDKFRTTLDSFDRHNLVHLSSNYTIPKYEPNPVEVERLMLSSLGAWINSRGVWEPPGPLSVEEWRQRGTMGRDHYVRVVYKGYLFPFGHHASLIKVTERKFHNDIPGNIAYLRQRMYIVVRQPERTFGDTGLENSSGHSYDRQMPFRRVRLTTLVTPNLNKPDESDVNGNAQALFWPRVGTQDFQFHIVAEDFEGNEIEFTTPLLFADQSVAKNAVEMQKAKDDLEKGNLPGQPERRKRDLRGQKLMLADSSKPGDTSFDTQTITFGAEVPPLANLAQLGDDDPPLFYPAVRKAELIIPSLKHIGDNHTPGEIKYADAYLKHGLDDITNNNGQLFGEFVSGVPMNFTGKGDKSGALVTPNMKVSGLSRAMGPVAGDVTKIAGGGFDPASFFGDLSPKIFGCIDLFNLIDKVDGLGNKLDLVPKFVTEALSNVEAFLVETENFRSSLQSISGSVPGVPALLTDVQTILQTDMPDILKPPFDTIDVKLAKLSSDLSTFSNHFTDLNNALPGADISDGPKRQLQKNIANFEHYLADASSFINDIKAFAGAIPLELPKEIKIRFDWKPKMKSWGFDMSHPLFIANDKDGKPCTLLIGIEMRARTDGKGSPSADIICSLENFALDLIAPASFIKLYFKKLQFLSGTSKKADINVEFGGIEFVGVLSFIEALRSLIPMDGFSDPPALEVNASGIHASFSIALPTLAVGMFSLQNMSLGAGFTIPFIGDPLSVYFNFCSRENPFLLTVAFLGGGGYFGITLDPRGVQLLEAAFEFGACLAVNFFVASGSVHIMAGIYLKIEKGDGSLTGYLRIGGEVSVLGLISASIELRMELTYEFSSGKVIGRATLTIEVHIIFFTISVELTCERKFAGSNGDPSFAQLMAPFALNGATIKPWEDYCMAFAS